MSVSRNQYHLPFFKNTLIEGISTDSPAHKGSFSGAIDFIVPKGTPVVAALNGTVFEMVDSSNKWGNDPKYANSVNLVTLKHKNGEYSQYLHLAKNSILVKSGEKVKKGQIIASTGLSGWMSTPHLHMFVFRRIKNKPGFEGLAIKFKV